MGNHVRREMTVRTTQVARQNPAYRPIAHSVTTSDDVSSEVVCFTNKLVGAKVNTRQGRICWLISMYLLFGCSSTRTPPSATPMPAPPPAPPVLTSPSVTAWTFNYSPGTMRYHISRSAAIESPSDSASRSHEVSANITNEVLTLTSAGDSGISFTAVLDTFSTTAQGLTGPVPSIQLPVQVTGLLTDHSMTIDSDSSTNNKCNPVTSTLVSDLHSLLTRFPVQLAKGMAWRDSTDSNGCQAAIPTISHTISSYIVSGEANYDGRPVLLIQRSDTVQAHGEGAQQQHLVKLDAGGTGNAVYYLDTKDGRVVRITAGQELNLTITTSAKVHQFRQSSRQDFRLVP
jgi:hypothetical protein